MAKTKARPKTRQARGPAQRSRSRATAEAERRAVRALSLMRKGLSRAQAARRAGTTPRTIQKYAKPAIRKRDGVYQALPVDQMRRPMRFLTEQGITVVDVRNSRSATRLSLYWSAVDHYLLTGDRSRLRPYVGKYLRASGHRHPYITDPILLSRLAEAGEVSFEDLYETTA